MSANVQFARPRWLLRSSITYVNSTTGEDRAGVSVKPSFDKDQYPFPTSGIAEVLLRAVVRKRTVRQRSDILRHGDVPKYAHLLLEGHTCRYRILSDGRRQITAVLMPGDICDLEAVLRGKADYNVYALTNCILGEIPAERIAEPAALNVEMTWALLRRLVRDEAIAREWLVGMGRRTALERVAHLLCELRTRLEISGLSGETESQMQFTQSELADILGLSTVHINRTLQELRRSGLIQVFGGRITITDNEVLEMVAGFDPDYLQLS